MSWPFLHVCRNPYFCPCIWLLSMYSTHVEVELALLLGSSERRKGLLCDMPAFPCILHPFPSPKIKHGQSLQEKLESRTHHRKSSLLTVHQIHGLCSWYNFSLWRCSLCIWHQPLLPISSHAPNIPNSPPKPYFLILGLCLHDFRSPGLAV